MVPKMDGKKLADALKRERPGVKVLCASGYTDGELIQSGAIDSDIHFIQKPYSPEGLALRVRQVLGGA